MRIGVPILLAALLLGVPTTLSLTADARAEAARRIQRAQAAAAAQAEEAAAAKAAVRPRAAEQVKDDLMILRGVSEALHPFADTTASEATLQTVVDDLWSAQIEELHPDFAEQVSHLRKARSALDRAAAELSFRDGLASDRDWWDAKSQGILISVGGEPLPQEAGHNDYFRPLLEAADKQLDAVEQ